MFKYLIYKLGSTFTILNYRFFGQDLPKLIEDGKYKLVKQIKINKSKYLFGIYIGEDNQKYFLKMWSGLIPDINLFWLENEMCVYKNYHTVFDSDILIEIPKLVYEKRNLNTYLVLTKYLDGRNISKYNVTKKIKLYENVIDKISNTNFVSDVTVNKYYYIIMINVLALVTFIKYPSSAFKLFKIIYKLPNYLFILFFNNKIGFVHRDVDETNIILDSSNKYYLIDFQISCNTYKELEIANIVNRLWTFKNILVLQKFVRRSLVRYNLNIQIYNAMILFCFLYTLVFDSKKDVNNRLDFLINTL